MGQPLGVATWGSHLGYPLGVATWGSQNINNAKVHEVPYSFGQFSYFA